MTKSLPLLFLTISLCVCDEHNHKYKYGDRVILWFQKVFPVDNRLESYPYSHFPMCLGTHDEVDHFHSGFLDGIQGLSLENSGLDVKFEVNVLKTTYCTFSIDPLNRMLLAHALRTKFQFDIYIDGLNVIGSFGEHELSNYNIFTNLKLKLHKNNDQIVKVELSQDVPVTIMDNNKIDLSYELEWVESSIKFEDRYDIYYDRSATSMKVRIISLINSLLMMIFLMCFAFWILVRTLRFDLMRYKNMKKINDSFSTGDQYGWKLVHNDVFRYPPYFTVLSALVGVGIQLFTTFLLTLTYAFVLDVLYETNKIVSYGLYNYIAISPISAFITAMIYKKYDGKRVYLNFLINVFFSPLLLLSATSIISIEARYMGLSRFLDIKSFGFLLLIFMLTVVPLSIIGYIVGKTYTIPCSFPADISEIPSPIPRRKWYLKFLPLVLFCGALPFGTIVVEMYFVFISFWATKIFFILQFMTAILLVMVIVSVCSCIIATYIFLNAEDYRWHWFSFLTGLSVSFYLFIYAINFQINRTSFSGFFQLSYFYIYSFVLSLCVGLIAGSFNYLASSIFVIKLYDTVKAE